jgi:bifunctional DNA primase/polymerase-like protein/primase-like protein
MSEQNYLQQALRMASYGARIVFFPGTTKACKVPGWQQIASCDPDTIKMMAAAKPDWTNYACVAKAEEDGILTFDDDDGVRRDYEAKHGPMIGTVVVKTWSGKLQYHFRHTPASIAFCQEFGNYISEKKGKGEKGEYWSLRMNNAYGVGPGSVVTEGDRTGTYSIAFAEAGIADCPDSLLDWCRSRYAEGEARENAPAAAARIAAITADDATDEPTEWEKPTNKKDWQKELKSSEPIEEGKRSDRLISIAGYLQHVVGLGEAEILAMLNVHNERRCTPKMEPHEIASIARSAAGYAKERNTVEPSTMTMDGARKMVQLLLYTKPIERVMSTWDIPENAKEAANRASDVIYEHLKGRGKFYHADGIGYLMLTGGEGKPIPVSDEDATFAQLLSDYGVNPGQDETKKVGQYIWMKASVGAERANVCYASHYNDKTKKFYFAEQVGFLIRVGADAIDRVPNGTDGELFVFRDQEVPFTVDLTQLPEVKHSLIVDTKSLLMEYLFQDLVFVPNALTAEDKLILLTTYTMLLVLAGVVNERPMLQMIGPSGTGKTFFLRCLGRVVVGPTFEVGRLPADTTQFENVLINNSLAFFDNVSKIPPEMKDIFCSAVTRFNVVRRELYTTTGQIEVPSKATVGFSALMGQLEGTEHANRCLLIKLLQRENGNLAEKEMLERLEEARPRIVAEVIVRGQMILRALRAQAKYSPRVDGRMAGVATLLLRVARHEGWESQAKELLANWNNEQLEGTLQNDDVAEGLHAWITKEGWTPKILVASEVSNELAHHVIGENSWKGNAKILSGILQKSQASYAHRFGLVIGEDKHRKRTTFLFNPTEAQMSLLKAGKTNVGVEAVALAKVTAAPSADLGEIWQEEGYRRGEGANTGAADVVKPGDYPSQEGCLTVADMGWLPKDERIPEDIKKEVERWSRVIVAGGWGGGAMDYPVAKAFVLFCKVICGRGELAHDYELTREDWEQAFRQMDTVYRSGGEEGVRDCLDGHNPDLKTIGGSRVAWTEGKRASWKTAAATEKGAARIRKFYGSRAVCNRMKYWIYNEAPF